MEWKSAVVAFSPLGRGMNSLAAPLIIVRGTRLSDTVGMLANGIKTHMQSRRVLNKWENEGFKVTNS